METIEYANKHHIKIIGDMPIYVSADSVVWTKPQLFKLDSERKPLYVAGVPADNSQRMVNYGKSYLRLART